MANPALIAKVAATLLADEETRKGIGWIAAAVLSPLILVVAVLCVLGSGAAQHNTSAAQLCFGTGGIPAGVPDEYRACIVQMRERLAELDVSIAALQENMEDGSSLDPARVKAIFYTLYFGVEAPDIQAFANCFVTYEERTRTVTVVDEEGVETEAEQTYTVPVPVAMDTAYGNIAALRGAVITVEQKSNADSVYNLIKYGSPSVGGRTVSSAPTGRTSTSGCGSMDSEAVQDTICITRSDIT